VNTVIVPDGDLSCFLRVRSGRSYREVLLEVIDHAVRILEELARWESDNGMSNRAAHRRTSVAVLEGLSEPLR
jgi:hypothetical protein